MGWSRLQACGNTGNNTVTKVFPSAVTSQSVLVCCVVGRSTITVSDNINGAWTALSANTIPRHFQSNTQVLQWFYKLSSGAGTVTVTCSSTNADDLYFQAAEYSNPGATIAYDTGVSTVGTGNGNPAIVTSGAPISGDLILVGLGDDNEDEIAFTTNSPLTALVLDNVGHTGGEPNGGATVAIGELLGSGSTPISGSIANTHTSGWAGHIIGFTATTAAPSHNGAANLTGAGALSASGQDLHGVTLSAQVNDSDGDVITQVTWDVWDLTLGGVELAGYPLVSTVNVASGSVVSNGVSNLTAGHQYQWTVAATDGFLPGPAAAPFTFVFSPNANLSVVSPAGVQPTATATIAIAYVGSIKGSDRTVVTDTTDGGVAWDSGVVFGSRTSWQIPFGVLTNGHSYSAKVTVVDINGVSLSAVSSAFSASWTVAATPRLQLLVNGADLTNAVDQTGWSVSQDWGRQGDTAQISLYDEYPHETQTAPAPNIVVPPMSTVELRDLNLGVVLFGGLVADPYWNFGSPTYSNWTLNCISYTKYADARVVSFDYTNQTLDFILKDLTSRAGIGVTTNNVAAGPVIPRVQGQFISLSQAWTNVCILASTDDTWGWWLDYNLDLHVQNQDSAPDSGVTFTDQPTGALLAFEGHMDSSSQTRYEWDATTLTTRAFVLGGAVDLTTTETYLGDGSTTQFPLQYPIETNPLFVEVNVGGVGQVVSTDPTTQGVQWLVVEGATGVWSIQVAPGAAAPAGGALIEVDYVYTQPIAAQVENFAGIGLLPGVNSGLFDAAITDTTLTSLSAAQARGQRETGEYGGPQERFTINTTEDWPGWVNVGQTVTVSTQIIPDSTNNYLPGLTDKFLVTQMRAQGAQGGYRTAQITAVRIS